MPGKSRIYFADSNTAKGFFSFHNSNLQNLNKVFILTGGAEVTKSTLIKNIGQYFLSKNFDVEFMHSSLDINITNGMIVPLLQLAIVSNSDDIHINPQALGAVEEYVNCGIGWNYHDLFESKDFIISNNLRKQEMLKSAYESFNDALKIHDEWEKIYIDNFSKENADEVTSNIILKILGNKHLSKKSTIHHRFIGTATPIGPVDFVQDLTCDIPKRYFIKGRPGTGKSTLLKKLTLAAELNGFDVEVYHCGFDPNSLDMLIFRELGIAIFDSTAPHEYFPEHNTDEIVDMYKLTIKEGTDEAFANQLEEIISRYSAKIQEGTQFLAKAKAAYDKNEDLYFENTDFTKIKILQSEIQEKIENFTPPNT